nr:H-NS histone family protein [Rhizobacter sp. SG703]
METPMSKTLAQLKKEIANLTREAEKLQRKEIEGVVVRIKEAIEAYGLTAADLGLGGAKRGPKAAGKKVAAKRGRKKADGAVKFRDENGNVWGGRGPRPKWLRDALAAGKQLTDFAV